MSNTDKKYIVVLAGGLKENRQVNDWVKERLDKTIEFYDNNTKIICCGGGTYHKSPVLDDNNYVIHECTACASYLIEKGIKKEDIYKEWSSYDTIANAYFCFIKFLIPLKIRKIKLITSEFHMGRSKYLFEKMGEIFNHDITIDYIETKNNMDSELLEVRSNREKESIDKYEINIFSKVKSIEDFTIWIHEEHNAYNNNYEISKPNTLLSKSY